MSSFTYWILPVFFVVFLMFYQAEPIEYEKNIDATFSKLNASFDQNYSKEVLEEEGTNLLIGKTIHLFIKSALFSAIAMAYLTGYIASIWPLEAEITLWILIIGMIISFIPWNFVLGLGFLAKDWWKKRKEEK